MTKFTGPLIVGSLDSDSTAATIDASGTATFTGGVVTVGETVSATATFELSPRDQQGGRGVFVQQATAATDTTASNPIKFTLPSGANIVNFLVDIEEPFDTAAGATAATVAVSADQTIANISVSASGRYDLAGNGASGGFAANVESLRSVTTTVEAWVSIQGSPTAMTVGQAMFSIIYIV